VFVPLKGIAKCLGNDCECQIRVLKRRWLIV
jgi:hypothetical protein